MTGGVEGGAYYLLLLLTTDYLLPTAYYLRLTAHCVPSPPLPPLPSSLTTHCSLLTFSSSALTLFEALYILSMLLAAVMWVP